MGIQGEHVSDASLAELIDHVEQCAPADRLGYRDQVLTFGAACIQPLVDLVSRRPALEASVASWLELLAKRDPTVKADALRALARLTHGTDGHYAREALGRLGATAPAERTAKPPGERVPTIAQAEVHARMIGAAREGRLVAYSELGTNRAHIDGDHGNSPGLITESPQVIARTGTGGS